MRLTADGEINSEGCPLRLVNGKLQNLCRGYELKADLDFDTNGDGKIDEGDDYWNDGKGWEPLGEIGEFFGDSAFRAVFEGNGHVIRNLYINRPDAFYQGLFGLTVDAIIRRVGLAGALTQVTGKLVVGGIVGYANSTDLEGVFGSGVVVSADNGTASYVGGLAGALHEQSSITNSFSSAEVVANGEEVGGLVGNLTSSSAHNVYSIGQVQSSATSHVGGLFGYTKSATVFNSYWATDATGQSSSDGFNNANYFGATLAELQCTSANNTECVAEKTLYQDWPVYSPSNYGANGGIAWVFEAGKLPVLVLDGRIDSDGDGVLDRDDAFPDDPAASIDTDGDGYPDKWNDSCDLTCQQNSGLSLDAFPNNPAASVDDDGDGYPDKWNDNCDVKCQQDSGLTLDPYLNDFDNDGVPDHLDPDNTADNGLPEMQSVPSEMHLSADKTGTVGLIKYQDLLIDLRAFDAVDGYDLVYKAKANDQYLAVKTFKQEEYLEVKTFKQEEYLEVPVGRHVLTWTATDKSGNESLPMIQVVSVYPHIQFAQAESIAGEPYTAKVAIKLTGMSPVYPLILQAQFELENSTLSQADVAESLDLSEPQVIAFNAGSLEAILEIPIIEDDIEEEDETLVITLLGALLDEEDDNYYLVPEEHRQHVLTVTERNLPPVVKLHLMQDDLEVTSIDLEGGDWSIEVLIDDPNGNDTHSIEWDFGELKPIAIENNHAVFSSSMLQGKQYEIGVTVVDSGVPPIEVAEKLAFNVLDASAGPGDSIDVPESEKSKSGKKKRKWYAGSSSMALLPILMLLALWARRRRYANS